MISLDDYLKDFFALHPNGTIEEALAGRREEPGDCAALLSILPLSEIVERRERIELSAVEP